MLRNIVSERENLVDHAAEAMIETEAFSAKLQNFSWREPGEGVFHPGKPFINLMIDVQHRMERGYLDRHAPDHFAHPGEILFVPPSADLYCNWTKGGGRALSCWIDIEAVCGRGGLTWRWPLFELGATLGIKNPYISMAMRRIVDELRTRSFASDVQVESALTFIMLELQRHLGAPAPEPASGAGRLSRQQVDRVEAMVLERDGQAVRIADLAEACGCTPRTLAALYRRTTGQTLREFIAGARIERAKRLLLAEEAMVKQVAYLAGFNTPAAFCAAFRAATGHTPTEFRALHGVATH